MAFIKLKDTDSKNARKTIRFVTRQAEVQIRQATIESARKTRIL